MKKDTTRHIVLKINVNEQENEVIRQSCAAHRKSVSAAGRDLLLCMHSLAPLQPQANRSGPRQRREGTRLGPSMTDVFPGRRGNGRTRLRL